jgi:hypothetical protein
LRVGGRLRMIEGDFGIAGKLSVVPKFDYVPVSGLRGAHRLFGTKRQEELAAGYIGHLVVKNRGLGANRKALGNGFGFAGDAKDHMSLTIGVDETVASGNGLLTMVEGWADGDFVMRVFPYRAI